MSEPDGFGYREDSRVAYQPTFQVAEGKARDTLLPAVILYARLTPDAEQIGMVMVPEMAERVAGELVRFAKRAREKHWE